MRKSIYLLAITASVAMLSCSTNSGSSTANTDTTANADTMANADKAVVAKTSSTDIKGIVWKELEKLPLALPLKQPN